MLKAIMLYNHIKDSIHIWLEGRKIPYTIWYDDDEKELRVDIGRLDDEQKQMIEKEFQHSLKDFDYLIIYY